jgi:hypothetical protein
MKDYGYPSAWDLDVMKLSLLNWGFPCEPELEQTSNELIRSRTHSGLSVCYELRLQKRLSIENVIQYSTARLQHSDR